MRTINVFNFISLDGCFEGPTKGDISWHRHDAEAGAFAADSMKHGSTLLFGRVTYDIMSSYWPTKDAILNNPLVAKGMNSAEKIVFSRTMKTAAWNNTRVLNGDIVAEVRKMKLTEGKEMTILGSGSIVTLFAENGLIDEYQFMVDPVVLGSGTRIFDGIRNRLNLKLTSARTFMNGCVLLCYTSDDQNS
jgi:dihydrofolate reductase